MIARFSFFKAPVTNITPYKTITLIDVFKVITGEYCKAHTHKLRLISNTKQNREYKASKFPYATFSGIFEARNENQLIQHSGLIAIDFDHLEAVEETRTQLLKDPNFETELLFVSPNGNGLKWIVAIDVEKYSHAENFQAIFNYIKNTYSIEIDKACKDVCRATFISYDPAAFIHPLQLEETNGPENRRKFNPAPWLITPEKQKPAYTPQKYSAPDTSAKATITTRHEVEVITRRAEASKTDLMPNYSDWLTVGFALADEFGEMGRDYFHRLSAFNSDYTEYECNMQFDKCLKYKKKGIISNLFKLAKEAGINVRV